MADMNKTLGEILSDPRILKIAPDAVRNMDVTKQEWWHKTLSQLKQAHFGGDLAAGFDVLFKAAEDHDWYFPLYSEAECAQDAARIGTNLVWLPSDRAGADDRPYILLVPGGGFVNVWNLTEGWPIAARFNALGYHVFILTYQVDCPIGTLDREMEDFARALALIRENAKQFKVDWRRYITCGFSAGGYLVCLWNVPEKGYETKGMPKPQAVIPVYPVTSWRQCLADGLFTPGDDKRLFGFDMKSAANSPFEIPDHAEGFPPCALFLTETDQLVNPEHSRLLERALKKRGIPCRLEAGASGGHGFADGTGMCMEGWIERAVRWYEDPAMRVSG